MARFRFQLESLLKIRKLREQNLQRRVAEMERQRRSIEDRLKLQQQSISSSKHDLHEQLIGNVDAQSLRWQAATTMQAMRTAQRLVLELAGVHRQLEAVRSELLSASRDRRALELLKERRLAHWRYQQEKAENDAMDELNVSRSHTSAQLLSIQLPKVGRSN